MCLYISEKINTLPYKENYWFGVAIRKITSDYNHCGVVYYDVEAKKTRILHLEFHYDLTDEELSASESEKYRWVRLSEKFDEDTAIEFASLCNDIYQSNKGNIPYGVLYDNALFDEATDMLELEKGEGIGLTCSTFVMLVVRYFGIKLVDHISWELREDDEKWHDWIVKLLRDNGVSEDHVRLVENEKNCIRIRPEEISVSCSCENKPAKYPWASTEGERVHTEIRLNR